MTRRFQPRSTPHRHTHYSLEAALHIAPANSSRDSRLLLWKTCRTKSVSNHDKLLL